MKIGLGTVQWGINYGIANKTGITSDTEIKKIIRRAHKNNINLLDTALIYGSSHEKIRKFCNEDFNIITKVVSDSKVSIENQIDQCISDLNRKNIYACLIHDGGHIVKNLDKWMEIKNQKRLGRIKKIGYSLYEVNDLESLLGKEIIPDIIQIPYNCINREFESYFKTLKKLNIEIHARSIFYQGLFFLKSNALPKKLHFFKSLINDLNKIADSENLKLNELAILFVLKNKYIDNLILGFDLESQLNQTLDIIKKKSINYETIKKIKSMIRINSELYNPSNW